MCSQTLSVMDRYRHDLAATPRLTREEETDLAERFRAGDQRAGNQLITACLPFVVKIAREYRRWGVPIEDLVQQGSLGLMKAASRYEPERGFRLLTYAAYWIRAEIREYVVRGYRIVRLGSTRTERRAIRAYRRCGVDSVEALAEVSGMPLKRAKQLWPILERKDMSTDHRYYDRDSLVERLHGPGRNPEEEVAQRQVLTEVRVRMTRIANDLDGRERQIYEDRIIADEPKTLRDLGTEFGVSKERVRQLELRTRDKFRAGLRELAPVL